MADNSIRKSPATLRLLPKKSSFCLILLLTLIHGNFCFTAALSGNAKRASLTAARHLKADEKANSWRPTKLSANAGNSIASRSPSSLPGSASAALDLSTGGGSKDDESSKLSLSAASFNLVKACLGSGILSLPFGVAAFGDVSSALVPASIIIFILGILSAYEFYSLGRTCAMEGASSIGEAWEKLVGPSTSWLVTLSCIITPLGAVLSYSIILGDFFSSLAKSMGVKGFLATRHASILIVTVMALYPLCMLKSLAALSPISMLGVLSVLLTCVFMGIRATDMSYGPSGVYYSTIATKLQPSFAKVGVNLMSPSVLILCSMAATAYLVHFVAPDFYNNLKSTSNKRFGTLTTYGFAVTTVVNIAVMCLGFLTFGGNCSGMILNNYSNVDFGASLCRILMSISLIGSYPFIISAMRTNYIKMTRKGLEVTDEVFGKVTRLMLGATTALALILENVGFVVSFNGALMGSAILYIFPSILHLKLTKKRIEKGSLTNTAGVRFERFVNKFLVCLGAFFAVLGGYVAVASSFFPHLLQ